MNSITVLPTRFASHFALLATAALTGSNALAFDFTEGDLLIGLRQPLGNYEMVVNLGPAKNLNNYAQQNPGATFTVTQYTSAMMSSAFSDLGGINWSAFASIVTIGSVEPAYAAVWLTRPRSSLNVKTDAWYGRLAFSQSQAASAIGSIGIGAHSAPGSTSATAVVLDGGVSYGYAARVGPLGDFGGKWLGNVEGATASDFVSSHATNRIDLYYVPPDPTNKKTPGQYLGYFDFAWNGVISFTAAGGGTTLTQPQILSSKLVGTNLEIVTSSDAGISEHLIVSSTINEPLASWTALATNVVGASGLYTNIIPTSGSSQFVRVVVP